jgi:hypothetical protein
MNKYESGKIYQIIAPDGTKYIGSTISSLTCRFGNHRRIYKAWKAGKSKRVSVFEMFDKYGIENCKIELIENFACSSKKELERREGEIIKSIRCINEVVAGRTINEYIEDNKEILHAKFKKYYQDNRDSQIERVKEYYSENTEKIKERARTYARENIDKIRERKRLYRKNNAEKVREQKRIWNQLNKDKVNARRRELRAMKPV